MNLKDLYQKRKISSKIAWAISIIGLITGIFGVYVFYHPLAKGRMSGVVYDIDTHKALSSVEINVVSLGSALTDNEGHFDIKIFESFNKGDTIKVKAQHEDYLDEESIYVVERTNIVDTIYLSPLEK